MLYTVYTIRWGEGYEVHKALIKIIHLLIHTEVCISNLLSSLKKKADYLVGHMTSDL